MISPLILNSFNAPAQTFVFKTIEILAILHFINIAILGQVSLKFSCADFCLFFLPLLL